VTFKAVAIAALLALCGAGTAAAQVAAPTPPARADPEATAVDEITVVGQVTRRTMGVYARTVGSGPIGRLSPRWDDRVCVRVVNMDAEHSTLLRQRIETVAAAIGLSPDPSPTCSPNISVYASDAPDALASRLIEAAPRAFRPVRNSVSLGDEALETFRTSDAPVRWWHVSLPLMVDTGQPAIVLGATETRKQDPMALAVTVRNASRLRGNVRDDLMGVTIILDIEALGRAPFSAVADYVSFVALAPVDPRVGTGAFDTVLNLFDRPGIPGLTLMDEDYLYALYSSSRAPASAALQADEIADRMATERARRGAANR
jgi:hypothetical protein